MAKIKSYSIEARADDRYGVAVKTGSRTLYVDQPLFAGGRDAGASPMEYLLSSLAGCIATTARIIADQQKLVVNGMDIQVEGSLDLDILYGKSKAGRSGVTGFKVSLAIDSEMSEEEKKSFFEELRSRCPVSDTIVEATPVAIIAG